MLCITHTAAVTKELLDGALPAVASRALLLK